MAIAMQNPVSPNEIRESNQTAGLIERVYDDLIELMARGGGPEAVIAFRSSEETQNRAYDLVDRQREGTLTEQETRELEAYTEREHFVRLAKARARLLLAQHSQTDGISGLTGIEA